LDKAIDYEVKYLLDASKVLDGFGNLSPEVFEFFEMKEPAEIAVQLLERSDRCFEKAGWLNRVRNKGKGLDLTFKKRYDVVGENLEAALKEAEAEGFSPDDDDYKIEMDWGYKKQTLSFSNSKTMATKKYDELELPDLQESIKLLKDKAPGKWLKAFDAELLDESRLFGPIVYQKYTGKFRGRKLVIEVWPLPAQVLVEISFKEKKLPNAKERRELLFEVLDEKGWVLYKEYLKTKALLN